MSCCISKGFFKQSEQWLMISDDMSFSAKGKELKMLNSKHYA